MKSLYFIFLASFMTSSIYAGFEVHLEGYIAVTQHKNSNGSLRLEIAEETSMPGTPSFAKSKEGTTTTVDDSFTTTDLRDAISSTREIVTDSDGDRNIASNSVLGGSSGSGGGGGGCLLR